MTTLRLPKRFNRSHTESFLKDSEILFNSKNSKIPNFLLRCERIEEVCLFTQLLLYKFVSFSCQNKCFISPKISFNKYIIDELNKSGFGPLISYYLKKDINDIFDESKQEKNETRKNFLHDFLDKFSLKSKQKKIERPKYLHTEFAKDFYIAPLILLRDEPNKQRLNSDFLEKIKVFYNNDQKIVNLVSTCLTEIFMNFWEHATTDSGTVMLAKGTKTNFELMFADNGAGIITTLKSSDKNIRGDILDESLKKGITSKKNTNHMGWGLWLVSTLCKINSGELEIYSEGRKITSINGKKYSNTCGYWKGTIIYLSIPLSDPKSVSDIQMQPISNNIKINWVQ